MRRGRKVGVQLKYHPAAEKDLDTYPFPIPNKFVQMELDMTLLSLRRELVLLQRADLAPMQLFGRQRSRKSSAAWRYFDRPALDRMLRSVQNTAAAEPVPAANPKGTP